MSLRDVIEREPSPLSLQEWQRVQNEIERRSWQRSRTLDDEWLSEPACACEAIDVDRVVSAFCPVHGKTTATEAPSYAAAEDDDDIDY